MRAALGFRRAWYGDLLAVAAFLALGFVLFWPVWSAGAATHMQIGGDQWRNVWFDEWTYRALANGHNPLYTDAASYPGGVNVLLNAGAPFLGVLFSPVTAIFGPIASYNLASTLALPLSAMAAYALIRRFVDWRPAAFAGGLLYGFGPEEAVHGLGGHVNLSFTPFVPLILLVLHEMLVMQRWRTWVSGLALGLLVTAQFFVSTEVLFETVLVGAVAVIAAAVAYRNEVRRILPHAARSLGVAVVVAVVLLAWPAWFIAKGPAHISGPVQLVAQAYRANLAAPVIPDSLQLVNVPSLTATADHFASGTVENGSYLGIPMLGLLLAGLIWRRRNKVVIVCAVGVVAAFILSMGGAMTIRSSPALNGSGNAVGSIPLPERLLAKLPLLENIVPSRFALLVTLFAAVGGAVLMCELRRVLVSRAPGRPWLATGVPVLTAAVALFPLLPASLLTGVQRDVTPHGFVAAANRIPAGSVTAVFPFASGTFPNPTMWLTDTSARIKTPGGSFFVPQGPQHHVAYGQLLGYTFDSLTGETFTQLAAGQVPDETPALRSQLGQEWARWHLTAVIAVPGACPHPTQALQFLEWLLGPPSAQVDGVYDWYGQLPQRLQAAAALSAAEAAAAAQAAAAAAHSTTTSVGSSPGT